MGHILYQRKFLTTRIFEITDNALLVKIKKPFNYFEAEYLFEDIIPKTYRKKEPKTRSLLSVVAALFLTVVLTLSWHEDDKEMPYFMPLGAFTFLLINVLGLIYGTEDNTNLFLNNGSYLPFFSESPDLNTVKEFIQTLINSQKNYLINRYATFNPHFSAEQVASNLQWLRNKGIINDNELNDLRMRLLLRRNSSIISNIDIKFSAN